MTIESAGDLEGMRAVGKLVARALREMRAGCEPGKTTEQLDDVGAAFLRRHGARSAPQLTYGFPGFNCISVNDELVHGVPGPRALRAGDVVKIDVTAELEYWGHSVIRDMCGHGVGRALHESPSVPNFFSPSTIGRLERGMVIALEPIIAERPTPVEEGADGWTIRTVTGCLAAHYEHTIVIHEGRAEILTAA